jgi:hypothetical protein
MSSLGMIAFRQAGADTLDLASIKELKHFRKQFVLLRD